MGFIVDVDKEATQLLESDLNQLMDMDLPGDGIDQIDQSPATFPSGSELGSIQNWGEHLPGLVI